MTEIETPAQTVDLDAADLIYILNSSRRRLVIEILAQRVGSGDRRTHFRQLANLVAARETNQTRIRSAKLRSAKSGLRQNHFPLLDGHNLIEWEKRSGMIHATDGVVEVYSVLETLERWCEVDDVDAQEAVDGER